MLVVLRTEARPEKYLSTGEVMFSCKHSGIAIKHRLALAIMCLIAADEVEVTAFLETPPCLLSRWSVVRSSAVCGRHG
jgi:hypothetical protein